MGEYLTAWERRRKLREELTFWRQLTVLLFVMMLIAFSVGRGIAGVMLGVMDLAACGEAAYVRAKLRKLPR